MRGRASVPATRPDWGCRAATAGCLDAPAAQPGRTRSVLRRSLIALALAGPLLLAPMADAAGDGVPYRGATEQGKDIKLIVDGRGRVERGAFAAVTDCGAGYKRFTGEFSFRAPLDRSQGDRFHDHGSSVESDATHTARYKWDIAGARKGRRKIAGSFDVEIVFRKDGREYVTCAAESVAYSAKRSHRGG